MRFARAGALLACLLSGCGGPRLDHVRRFPIGLFGMTAADDVRAAAGDGFDAVQTYVTDPQTLADIASEAGRRGLCLIADPSLLLKSPPDRTRGWPVLAWYLYDEPGNRDLSSATVSGYAAQVRAWDPGRATALTVGEGRRAGRYAGAVDALLVDWYPVPHFPLESLKANVQTARALTPEGIPVWAVVQAFDWSDYRKHTPATPRTGRFPTRDEIRYMVYSAIVGGAEGILFFTYTRPSGEKQSSATENWAAVTLVAKELRALSHILRGGKRGPFPAALPPKMSGVSIEHEGRRIAFLVNDGDQALLVPEALRGGEWSALFENSRSAAASLPGGLLQPRQVLVLQR